MRRLFNFGERECSNVEVREKFCRSIQILIIHSKLTWNRILLRMCLCRLGALLIFINCNSNFNKFKGF